MYKHILEEYNIEWMGIIPLIIFVVFFVGLLLYVWLGNPTYFKQMSQMPFSENYKNSNPNHEETLD